LLFLSIFDPQIPLAPNGVGVSFLIVLISIIPIIFYHDSLDLVRFFKKIYPFLFLFALSFSFICFRIIFNSGDNFEFLLSNLKAVFVFLSFFSIYLIYFRNCKADDFFSIIVSLYVINGIINYVAGTFPDYFGFLSWFRGDVTGISLGNNPYRNSFISGSGYYSIGVSYGLICLLFSFHISRSKNNGFFNYLALVFVAFTGFVAARTSFFGSGSAFIYMAKAGVFKLILFFCIAFSLILLLLQLPELQPYKVWMLSFFLDFEESGSARYLIERMYFWPGSSIFLFGSGYVNDGSFVYTDGGYMQDILFGGILFVLIKLSFLILFFYRFFKKFPFFVILVCGAIMAFHFKGLFLYNNAQGMSAFYLIYFYMLKVESESRAGQA
jgi:hypothetical protein